MDQLLFPVKSSPRGQLPAPTVRVSYSTPLPLLKWTFCSPIKSLPIPFDPSNIARRHAIFPQQSNKKAMCPSSHIGGTMWHSGVGCRSECVPCPPKSLDATHGYTLSRGGVTVHPAHICQFVYGHSQNFAQRKPMSQVFQVP